MNNYSENLFAAIDTIVQSRINELEFDKTVVCTITDNSKRLEGIYKVKQDDGGAEFEAHSEIVSYKNDMKVLVLVPKNDYGNVKTITGRYVSNESEIQSVKYIEPFDNCLDITGNLITQNVSGELAANGATKEINLGWEWIPANGEDIEGFTRLGLSADFKALLSDYYPTTGNYGLHLHIEGEPIEGSISNDYYLDSSNMYGNPFGFDVFYNQQIIFDISNFRNISKITINFYQSGNFKDIYGNEISSVFLENEINNLFVENLYLFFGYDLAQFTEETLILYSPNSLSYDNRLEVPETKNLRLRWIRKDGNYTYVQKANTLTDATRIHWYIKSEDVKDPIAGDNWLEIASGRDLLEINYNPNKGIKTNNIKAILFHNDEMDNTWDVSQEINEGKKYISNELVLESLAPIADQGAINAVNALHFNFVNDTYNGIYNIYGSYKRLKNSADAARERQIVPRLEFENGEIVEITEENDVVVTWKVPAINSMINPSYAESNKTEDKQFYLITDKTFKYRISNLYTEQSTRNTIVCTVVRNGQTYTKNIDLTFGIAGSAGTDYTFVIKPAKKDNENNIVDDYSFVAYPMNSTDELYFKAVLYDYNNEVVKLDRQTVKWSWVDFKNVTHAFNIPAPASGHYICLNRNNNTGEAFYYNILKATITTEVNWQAMDDAVTPEPRTVTMEAFYPIAFTANKNYYASGASEVIYDDSGSNPTYTKDY